MQIYASTIDWLSDCGALLVEQPSDQASTNFLARPTTITNHINHLFCKWFNNNMRNEWTQTPVEYCVLV